MTSVVHSFRNLVAASLAGAITALVPSQLAVAQEPLKNLVMHEAPQAVPAIDFVDGQGQARSLADLKGKVTVLNIWATWCVPCRKEMPALDRLQAVLGGPEFAVVPISIDRGGIETVAKFYQENGIRNLAMYVDLSGKAARELRAVGLPATLILDRAGQEIGRIIGPAEWDSPEVVELLKPVIANEGSLLVHAGSAGDRGQVAQPHLTGALARGFQWLKALLTR